MAVEDPSLLASILDRLIDLEPQNSREASTPRTRQIAQIKAAVKRDLEWLLNTRQMPQPASSQSELHRSIIAYGLPDFSSLNVANPTDHERLRQVVRKALERFEPRLRDVVVSPVEGREFDRSIQFRIEGLLDIRPNPEPVRFDSKLQLHTKAFVVEAS